VSSRKEEREERIERTGCSDGFVGDDIVEGDWTILLDPARARKGVRLPQRVERGKVELTKGGSRSELLEGELLSPSLCRFEEQRRSSQG